MRAWVNRCHCLNKAGRPMGLWHRAAAVRQTDKLTAKLSWSASADFPHTKSLRCTITDVKQSRQMSTSRSRHSKIWQSCRLMLPVQCSNTHAWATPEREGDCVIPCSAHSCDGELLALLHSGSIELLRLALGLWGQSENVPEHPILKLIPSLTCRHRRALTVGVCLEATYAEGKAPSSALLGLVIIRSAGCSLLSFPCTEEFEGPASLANRLDAPCCRNKLKAQQLGNSRPSVHADAGGRRQ